jgi:hypothetical protein
MSKTHDELQQLLNVLSRSMPTMIKSHPEDEEFWPAFAREADAIQDSATARDFEWVSREIDNILREHGKAMSTDLGPSDDLPPRR